MTMLTGYFHTGDEVRAAVRQLVAAGFEDDSVARYYLSPSGQHSVTLDEGEQRVPDAEGMAAGAAGGAGAGAAAGAMAGAATIPLTGPIGPAVGAAVGAYVGSLHGALGGSSAGADGEGHGPEPIQRGGPAVTVEVSETELERALQILREAGALDVRRSEGHVVGGRVVR